MEGRGYDQPYYPNYGYPYQQYPQYAQYPPKKELNILALISMISSLVGVFFFPGAIVGPILGFIALNQIKNEPQRYEGKGFALTGIIVGLCIFGFFLLIMLFYFFMFFMVFATL